MDDGKIMAARNGGMLNALLKNRCKAISRWQTQ